MSNLFLEKRKMLNITRKDFCDALGLSKEEEKWSVLWEKGKIEIPDSILTKIIDFPTTPPFINPVQGRYKTIDLFAGIGGIRLAFQNLGCKNVFSSEWDAAAQKTYRINFGELPAGDITQILESEVPDHDILLAGFPCQPFSQAGLKRGFEDARGTMFFHIARILKEKQPKAFLLENVKQLRSHDKGRTLQVILEVLNELGYYVPEPQILNARDFGIPQNRERIFIVGFNKKFLIEEIPFEFPRILGIETCVGDILENQVDEKYTISDNLYNYLINRKVEQKNKGNGFGYSLFNANSKYTNTISARYYKDGSEVLIEQESKNPRMLTPRECARLQGFPEEYIIPVSNAQIYKQFGNSVCVPVVQAIAEKIIEYLDTNTKDL